MSEYIKKEDTIEYLNDLFGEMCHVSFGDVLQSIDSLRTYSFPDSAENKGEWISTEDRPDGFCSKCDHDIAEASTPYCPYCGAKMTWVGAIREPYKKGE